MAHEETLGYQVRRLLVERSKQKERLAVASYQAASEEEIEQEERLILRDVAKVRAKLAEAIQEELKDERKSELSLCVLSCRDSGVNEVTGCHWHELQPFDILVSPHYRELWRWLDDELDLRPRVEKGSAPYPLAGWEPSEEKSPEEKKRLGYAIWIRIEPKMSEFERFLEESVRCISERLAQPT